MDKDLPNVALERFSVLCLSVLTTLFLLITWSQSKLFASSFFLLSLRSQKRTHVAQTLRVECKMQAEST